MIDDFAKAYLHEDLRWARRSILAKVEGLSEYDRRRPLTRTGTNLLGLVKHLTVSEARYLGDVLGRPFPQSVPRFDDPHFANRDSLWVTEQESYAEVIDGYQRACRHADATIDALPIDAACSVPWWPQPDAKLFNVMVHVLTETNRHAGHADILREQIDGAVGAGTPTASALDEAGWAAHRSKVEEAARAAGSLS
ncbi:DinB family protein [Cellulomonas phragmiteti]|nr:DinB family protein [Cellulomonas phragmiteti]